MKNRRIVFAIIAIIVVLSIIYSTKLWIRFWEIDSCLDRGGSWNYQLNKCDGYFEIDSANLIDFYWSTDFDTLDNKEYLIKGKMLDSISHTTQMLIEILNKRKVKSKIEYKDLLKDTIVISVFESEYLSEQMGTTGAHCFLGETVFTLTENPIINFVRIEMEAGSHATPGIYNRSNFLDLVRY
jgi:hypothetical protein